MSTLTAKHALINFLKEQNLKLKKKHFDILHKEEITGLSFLDLTEEKFCSIGFALGSATLLTRGSDPQRKAEACVLFI
ncbi:hypothetical protein GLOIN_2v1823265 [Rhizophagus clarus]|uniref:SAM domain-containing protein n=1 Tax=Rhizophagus clarus TaxID=94130 RepID=A0A8H3QZB3_9GLOM|nr:hypothetical protein GLOIN_2v1823265 [Rhizophagus clarus]